MRQQFLDPARGLGQRWLNGTGRREWIDCRRSSLRFGAPRYGQGRNHGQHANVDSTAAHRKRFTAPGETGSPALDLVDDPGDLPQRDHDVLNALIAGNHRCYLRGEAPHHLNLVCARRVDRE